MVLSVAVLFVDHMVMNCFREKVAGECHSSFFYRQGWMMCKNAENIRRHAVTQIFHTDSESQIIVRLMLFFLS